MPVVFIEAPPGIGTEAKKTLMQKITTAIDEAYHIGDTLYLPTRIPGRECSDGWEPAIREPQDSGGAQEDRHLSPSLSRADSQSELDRPDTGCLFLTCGQKRGV
jgi:hypothetical protein